MSEDSKKEFRGSTVVEFENPGDMMVGIIQNVFSRGASMVVAILLEKIFSGEMTIEEVLWLINQRGLEIKFAAGVEIPGKTGDKGEIDPPLGIAYSAESITVKPGMLNTAEVEPAQAAIDDPDTVH